MLNFSSRLKPLSFEPFFTGLIQDCLKRVTYASFHFWCKYSLTANFSFHFFLSAGLSRDHNPIATFFCLKPVKLLWMEEEDYPVAYAYLGPIHVSPVRALKVSSYLPSFASNSSVIEKCDDLTSGTAFLVNPSNFPSLLSRSYQALNT